MYPTPLAYRELRAGYPIRIHPRPDGRGARAKWDKNDLLVRQAQGNRSQCFSGI